MSGQLLRAQQLRTGDRFKEIGGSHLRLITRVHVSADRRSVKIEWVPVADSSAHQIIEVSADTEMQVWR